MIGLREQGAHIRGYFPHFAVRYSGGELIAEGRVQPTTRSTFYRLKVGYRVGSSPKVRVLSPDLALREGAVALPHVYPENRLCLHLPGEWTKHMSIALTTIPWAIEWLFHYECWFASGEWHGGGATHVKPIEP